jgi:hypothetical protein
MMRDGNSNPEGGVQRTTVLSRCIDLAHAVGPQRVGEGLCERGHGSEPSEGSAVRHVGRLVADYG